MNAIRLLTALCETDVDGIYTHWEVAKIVESVRLECLAKGIDAGPEQTAMTPREGLAEVGRLMALERKPGGETLTPPQVARLLHVGPEKVLNWIRKGELPATNVTAKPGGRAKYRVNPDDLKAFQRRRTPQAKVKTVRAKPSGKSYV